MGVRRPRVAAALLLGTWLMLMIAAAVSAASPGPSPTLAPAAAFPNATSPSPSSNAVPTTSAAPAPGQSAGIIETGDPRSNGQGPGLVGSPVAILVGVILLGAAAATGTAAYLRLTRRR